MQPQGGSSHTDNLSASVLENALLWDGSSRDPFPPPQWGTATALPRCCLPSVGKHSVSSSAAGGTPR